MKKQHIDIEHYITGILAIIIFLVNIRHIDILNGPYMFNDELGYLGNAAALAGKDWHEVMQYCAWYSFGWSIVIAPLFKIFSSMQIIYRCINVFNAILVVAVYFMQRHLLQKIFKDVSSCVITAASACACFYPCILVNSSMAWSEIWLLFVFTAITFFVYYIVQTPRSYKAAVLAGLLYYLYICHNRMIAVLIAGVLIFIVMVFTGVIRKKDIFFFLGALLVSGILFGLIKDYLIAANWRFGLPHGNDISSGLTRLKNLLTLAGIQNFVGVVFSQFLYVCISSYGMLPLGIYAVANKMIQTIRRRKTQSSIVELWLMLSFFGMFAVSCISMGGSPDISGARLDHIFYGRYFEPTIIMLLSYGVLYLVNLKKNDASFSIYKISYLTLFGVCTFIAFVFVQHLKNPVFNKPNASGIAIFVEKFKEPTCFVFAAALFSIIGTAIFVELFSHKNIFKYIALSSFAVSCFFNAYSAEKAIIRNQEAHMPDIPLAKSISTYDTSDLPIYILCDGTLRSYFQCMLPDIPLKYTRNLSLTSISDEKYYIIVSNEIYTAQGFDVFNRVIDHNANNLFLYVDKTINDDKKQVTIFLENMHLKDFSTMESDNIHVESTGEALAFYGPYMKLNTGSYRINIAIDIESTEKLENYGTLQIYSSSKDEVFSEFEITEEFLNGGIAHISFPFLLGEDINDVEIYLRTKPATVYDIYDITLEKEFIFDYELNTDEIAFDIEGFSHMESQGRWIDGNESSVCCYLPSDDYQMTVDLGYSLPFEQLDFSEYSASVHINDRYLGDITLIKNETNDLYQFDIPNVYIQDGANTISIRCEELWSPADYGSSDDRTLGLCIERIIFMPVE